jgi:hypothetical protein
MFTEATNRHTALYNGIQDELWGKLEHLDKTASTWFDQSTASVEQRKSFLYQTAGLALRVAALSNEEDSTDLHALAQGLERQAVKLSALAEQTNSDEFENQYGSTTPVFSSKGMADESHTAATYSTDWDVFLAIEPREFVAANRSALASDEEMRRRAFVFMENEVSGHGLTRKAKMEITSAFLQNVEISRQSQASVPTRTSAKKDEFEMQDIDLYI